MNLFSWSRLRQALVTFWNRKVDQYLQVDADDRREVRLRVARLHAQVQSFERRRAAR